MITITDQDTDVDWKYEYYSQDYLLDLLTTSSFEGMMRTKLENEINDTESMSKDLYDKIVFKLYSNQLDRITSGFNYSATDILKHLKKLL